MKNTVLAISTSMQKLKTMVFALYTLMILSVNFIKFADFAKLEEQPGKKDKLYWYVFSGRHFNDIVTNSSDGGLAEKVVNPTFLFLYTDECQNEAEAKLKIAKRDFPYEQYVMVAKQNYGEESRKMVYYEFDEKDDLKQRYVKSNDCLHQIYFEAGSNLDEYSVIPNHFNLGSFFWNRLLYPVLVANSYEKNIIVKTSYGGESYIFENILRPGEKSKMHSYMTNMITVIDTSGNFLYGTIWHGNESKNKLTINTLLIKEFKSINKKLPLKREYVDMDSWIESVIHNEKLNQAQTKKWRTEIGRMYLIALQYPLTLPKISTTGYQISTIDSEIFKKLQNYCQTVLLETEGNEEKQTQEPLINNDYAPSFTYNFTTDLKMELEDYIKTLAENFVETKLKIVKSNLISFSRTAFVRNHIDVKPDHVITALIIIGQDNNLNETKTLSWPAEVIDFKGKRVTININPAEIFIYEAKTIIYGRRKLVSITEQPYFVAVINLTTQRSWPLEFVDKDDEVYKSIVSQHQFQKKDFRSRKVGFSNTHNDDEL